jgi:cytochrome b involved in lipid metabolism
MAAMMDVLNSTTDVEAKGVLEAATDFIANTLRTLIFTPSTPSVGHASENDNKLHQISLSEVAEHDTFEDCWIVIYDRVYDITNFFDLVSFLNEKQFRM